MAFRVRWAVEPLADLATFWMASVDRSAVTSAQHTIDMCLSSDPHKYGRYLVEGLWQFHATPLLVHFDIDDASGWVSVTQLDLVPSPP
jgi:hypothetical protein